MHGVPLWGFYCNNTQIEDEGNSIMIIIASDSEKIYTNRTVEAVAEKQTLRLTKEHRTP